MNDLLSLFTYVNLQEMKRIAYKEIYSGNSLNVFVCLTTAWITDGSHRWQIGITFIKHIDPKIVLPHRCRILRFMHKTPPQSTMPTGLEHVVGPRHAPFNSLELCIERRTPHIPVRYLLGYRDFSIVDIDKNEAGPSCHVYKYYHTTCCREFSQGEQHP